MKKILKYDFRRWFEFLLSMFVVTFLISPKLSNLFIFLLIVIVVLGYIRKNIYFNFNNLNYLFIGFYFCYIVGSIWTNHPSVAIGYLEKKLSLLVFPLLFSFNLKEEKLSLRLPIIAFVFGLFFLTIQGLLASFNCFFSNGSSLCFSASTLSSIHHPTYFSVFLFFSMGLVWYGYKNNFRFFNFPLVLTYLIFAILVQSSLMSLAGVLYLYFFLGLLLFFYLIKKFNKMLILFLFLVGITISFSTVKYIPYLRDEIGQSQEAFKNYIKNPIQYIKSRKYPLSGNDTRLTMWETSLLVFEEHIFGVGTGNVDDYLADRLNDFGQTELAKQNYNPHNQFLQIAVEIGIIGLLLFIILIGSLLKFAFINRNYLILILVTSLIFNSLFESMLQRHSGIVFYCFWITLIITQFKKSDIIFKVNHIS
jgi:O-antigen ligase